MEQRSFFGLSEHLARLTEIGDPLETLEGTIDFEYFRGWLVEGLGYGDGAKGGRPAFDNSGGKLNFATAAANALIAPIPLKKSALRSALAGSGFSRVGLRLVRQA